MTPEENFDPKCECGSIDGNRTTVYCDVHKGTGVAPERSVMIGPWEIRMMQAARFFGTWSKCMSRQIGAVIVHDKTIIATGYNGPPRGVPECNTKKRYEELVRHVRDYSQGRDHIMLEKLEKEWGTKCPRQIMNYKSGQGLHICPAGHAESNAITNAAPEGVKIKDKIMYCYCPLPCMTCAKDIINSGLQAVFYLQGPDYDITSRWMLNEAGVYLIAVPKEMVGA